MTEIILGLITLASIALNAWSLYNHQEQEKRYIKALLSKDVKEFVEADIAVKPKKKKEDKVEDEFIPMSDLSDEAWEKAIKKDLDAKK